MTVLNVQLLTEKTSELANHVTRSHFERDPGLLKRYGESGKLRCYEDAIYHLNFLAEALTMDIPDMYASYILWAAAMLKSRNIPESDLHHNLDFVQQAIHEILGPEFSAVTMRYVAAAKEKLKEKTEENVTYITDDNPLKKEVETYLEYLLQGKRQEATLLIAKLIQKGVAIKDIYEFIFQVSQYEVGQLWQCNKITVAHEHYCTAATQQIMSGLYQHIFSAKRKGKTLVACSISGELHELGIRMVTDFFEMEGWDTYYLGANMPDNQLQEALKEYRADVLALSVTLPTQVSKAKTLIKKIRDNRDLASLKIMVGGYPFLANPDLWQRVAADGFAQNANQAIFKANELVNL
ncbi:cobalamin B12-binding domain-containing protein [Pleomorphovibrio marinus]|uniref:cobalamin B12-binding domain-containing protein n=1 Tax=Pleomorphovibrio marinus TaxID=2164132 RepID=UPI000E0A7BF2|nr:cobalamin-dependent protein [Pleomorphovibrio marinus]